MKLEYPGENLSEKSRKLINLKHMASNPESNPRHFGGMRLLSPLCKPSDPQKREQGNRAVMG